MEIAIPEPQPDAAPSRGVVRREEWRRRGSGGLQHTQIEATHWSAPAHTYGKVVEGVSCVGADGRSLRARRQVEVLSARGPGLLQVLTSTHTTSHSHSSTTTGFNRNFDDLQLALHPLDVSSQKDRLSIGRSGSMGTRRPPSKIRPQIGDGNSTVSRLCHWFDMDSQQLQSPSIVANGTQKVNGSGPSETVNGDKTLNCQANSSKDSEDSLYDSCPEKESVFKDETGQLEEWRRASKIRRSLQYPGRSTRTNSSKPLDLPDNWGSVSRIKKELESCQNNSWFTKSVKNASLNMILDDSEKSKVRHEDISEPEAPYEEEDDDYLIKPSTLKKKSFIDLDTLTELRSKLKTVSNLEKRQTNPDLDDGIDAEETIEKQEEKASVPNVRSYVYGMEAALNQNKPNYSCGTNSLESRVSKLINGISHRSDDWHTRRKSYGFEKVSNQKVPNSSLSNHDKNTMESSTDSGICRSTEVVNSVNSTNGFKSDVLHPIQQSPSRSTIITLGNTEKKDSFETWLLNNRKPFSASYNKYMTNKEDQYSENKRDVDYSKNTLIAQSANQISISIQDENKEIKSLQRLSEERDGTNDSFKSSSVLFPTKPEDYSLKRHTIAVDGLKTLDQINDYNNDIFEKKNKKVEFCKTEVHFTADSGRVNIVETDGKPPSTNNFRRRRRNSSALVQKENTDKSKLPVTHFGDSFPTNNAPDLKTNEAENKEPLKLNYAIITDIKSSSKEPEQNYDTSNLTTLNGNSDEISESEQRRGILKNKPIKPIPYHLGEDKTVLSEINNTQYNTEKNVWGIKLKPIQNKSEAPLWCSSVALKSNAVNDTTPALIDSEHTGYGKIEKSNIKSQCEIKGYSTKINFGNGDPIVESMFNVKDKISATPTDLNGVKILDSQKDTNPSAIISKYLNFSSNPLFKDDLKPVNKTASNINNETKKSQTRLNAEEKEMTFADSISTPRSLMPTRGSARKLKEHELSYFGVKSNSDTSENTNSLKRHTQGVKEDKCVKTANISKSDIKYTSPRKAENYKDNNPIYENVNIKKSSEVSMKRICSGESIIDELTKAADEILQALNEFSDDDSVKNHSSEPQKGSQQLATISEKSTWNDKSRGSEHKAVQTIIGGTKRYNSLTNTKSSKTRTSSNSSLESISRETKVKKKPLPVEVEKDRPEKPLRKKSSSGEVVKARRLQRASSREALLHIHGSSSEDIAGHLEVTRKKTTRRSKHNGDSLKREDSKTSLSNQPYTRSVERKKESRSSTKYITNLVPEIRHKTTVSTIMSLGDRNSSLEKSKSSHERSRHKERVREGTISSMARDLLKLKERSRSTDTSLERDNKEKYRSREHRKERPHRTSEEKVKQSESDKLKKISEESDDKEKKNKFIIAKKSSVSATNSASVRNIQRGTHSGRSYDRLNAGGKVTNTRTEYDKNLRLI